MTDESQLARALRLAMGNHVAAYGGRNALDQGDYGYGTPVTYTEPRSSISSSSLQAQGPWMREYMPKTLADLLSQVMTYAPMALGLKGQTAHGAPIRAYHGTNKDLMTFSPSDAFFARERALAENYARIKAQEQGGSPRVYEVELPDGKYADGPAFDAMWNKLAKDERFTGGNDVHSALRNKGYVGEAQDGQWRIYDPAQNAIIRNMFPVE